MDLSRVADWLKHHRWWVALVVVVVAGYSIGKDIALRDNQRSSALHSEQGR